MEEGTHVDVSQAASVVLESQKSSEIKLECCNNGSHRWAIHYIITVYTEPQERGTRGSFLPTHSTNKSNHLIWYHRDVKHEPGRHLNRPYSFGAGWDCRNPGLWLEHV